MKKSTTARVDSELTTRRGSGSARSHRLPVCEATGLARYRDRHQARDGARAMGARVRGEVFPWSCPDCRGYHLDEVFRPQSGSGSAGDESEPVAPYLESLAARPRRYWLVDIENPTRGAKASREEVAAFWGVLKQQAPGIAPYDHVVVGAGRYVARKYRDAITGDNVKWVVGANRPDGADRALLGAVDLRRVARDYDELVIVSGDHAFVELAERARRLGLAVHVITAEAPGRERPALSRALGAVANRHSLVRVEPRSHRRAGIPAAV